MSNDLLKQLEEKISAAIETIELSRLEITDLKEQNDELENRYVDWEERLSALIEKFELLEDDDAAEVEAAVEAVIQRVDEEETDAVLNEIKAETVEDVEEDSNESDTEGSTFDTSADSYTEAPGSAQHYA
ncbi:MAG: cell division protein ZapB [SAR324 cluster bacterium]|nr:cell division protein ZapB [SAR324 cluster bacterium]